MKSLPTIAIVVAGIAFSQDTGKTTDCMRLESCSLQGQPKVLVLVEALPKELRSTGISEKQLKTEIELLLRKFGVPVVKSEAADLTLYFAVDGSEVKGGGMYYVSIKSKVTQTVRLVRNPSIVVVGAVTWDTARNRGFVLDKSMATITARVTDQTKQFINAYLEANPK